MMECDICGISEAEVPLETGTFGVFCDRKECAAPTSYTPRQRHYAALTPELLDALENEADIPDHEACGTRRMSGAVLHALVRVARTYQGMQDEYAESRRYALAHGTKQP